MKKDDLRPYPYDGDKALEELADWFSSQSKRMEHYKWIWFLYGNLFMLVCVGAVFYFGLR